MDQLYKLENFFSQFKYIHYKKGETIVRPGEVPQGVYYLKKGYAKAYSTSREGKELTIIIFKPEDIFPYSWAISGIENKYYYEAMTPVEVRRVSKEELLKFINDNSDIVFTLTNRIVIRMMGLAQRMEHLAFGNAYTKVASILLICAQRFGEKKNGGIEIEVPLTHKDIAALLGVARETVSVELKKLERKGLVEIKNRHLIVKKKELLEKEALLF